MSVPGPVVLALLVHVRLVISSILRLIGPGMGFWLNLELDEAKAERAMYPDQGSLGTPTLHHPGYTHHPGNPSVR